MMILVILRLMILYPVMICNVCERYCMRLMRDVRGMIGMRIR